MDDDARVNDALPPPFSDEMSILISQQDLSWQKGEPLSIEQLYATLQSKSADGRELLDFICNEVYLRQLNGETPALEDYQQRFPEFAKVIAIQWKVDGFLGEFAASDDSTSRPEADLEESVNQFDATKVQSSDEVLQQPTTPLHEVPPELLKHPNYQVRRLIGRGGMGTVWLAEQLSMQRMVALKLIRSELAAKPEAIARFRREVHAAAKLRHPNIVIAHDAGSAGPSHFLVFEYIDGLTLAKCVESGPLPINEACSAIRDAGLGLAHAHAAGLVHRDVKPGNLIRDTNGVVKVLDFGLVVEPTDDLPLTGDNIVMGTADYISPEQANDPRLADARSDIYSLGCTLYHLLSGRAPFKGMSQLKKLDAQRFMSAEPISNVPPALQETVAKMMAKHPDDRFQNVLECVHAITPFCNPNFTEAESKSSEVVETSRRSQILPLLTTESVSTDIVGKLSRVPRRLVVTTCVALTGCILLLTWQGCVGSKNQLGRLSTITLNQPSSSADGNEHFKIEKDHVILNAMNYDQVWLNYEQVNSDSMEIQANFRILDSRGSEPMLKFVFQPSEGKFHEYGVQFRIRDSTATLVLAVPGEGEKVLGKAKVDLKLDESNSMRFRVDPSGLTLSFDDKPVLRADCEGTRYYACVAALYCAVEVSGASTNVNGH